MAIGIGKTLLMADYVSRATASADRNAFLRGFLQRKAGESLQ